MSDLHLILLDMSALVLAKALMELTVYGTTKSITYITLLIYGTDMAMKMEKVFTYARKGEYDDMVSEAAGLTYVEMYLGLKAKLCPVRNTHHITIAEELEMGVAMKNYDNTLDI